MAASLRNRRAFLTLEAILATLLVIEMMAMFALFMTNYVVDNDRMQTQQRAALAAEAVMNEIRSGSAATPVELATRYKLTACDIDRQPGGGAWTGFQRVRVRVTAGARNGAPTRVQLEAYVLEPRR